MLFVICAPSGAGKTTILKEVFKHIPELEFSVSATTRKKRANETEGKDYYFISKEDFDRLVEDDKFIEWEIVHENLYGTLKEEIDKKLAQKKDIILDVDVKGAVSIKHVYKDSVSIYINSRIEDILQRLKNRKTETEEEIKIRVERYNLESALKHNFDYIVENNEGAEGLKKAKEEVLKLINKYRKVN
jgi:guanylate kinase